jgi:hypothetical protein
MTWLRLFSDPSDDMAKVILRSKWLKGVTVGALIQVMTWLRLFQDPSDDMAKVKGCRCPDPCDDMAKGYWCPDPSDGMAKFEFDHNF